MYSHRTQTFIIRLGNVFPDSFTVSNDVQHGSILSPVLFNVYIDSQSLKLAELKIGSSLNSHCFNQLIYADDTVSLAPFPKALRKLIDYVLTFTKFHRVKYNNRTQNPWRTYSTHLPWFRVLDSHSRGYGYKFPIQTIWILLHWRFCWDGTLARSQKPVSSPCVQLSKLST